MTEGRRRALGLVAVAALAAVVAWDRFSATGAAADDAAPPSSADLLAQEATLTARMRAEADALDERRAALADIEAAWSASRERMIGAGSADIAFARLREIVEAAMTDLGLRMTSAASRPVETPLEDEPLRVIGLRLDFNTTDTQRVYALVDRLENLREAAAVVDTVRVVGPGRLGAPSADVTIELRALAWIGPET